ncbi:MAG: hypothetical protein ACTHQE_12690 [Thermomicrobiales bacterium]
MPSLTSGNGLFGAVGSLKNFVNVVKEVDFEEVRARAERVPTIIVISSDADHAFKAAVDIFGERPERYVEVKGVSEGQSVRIDAYRYEVVIVYDPDRTSLLDRVKQATASGFNGKLYFLAASLPGMRTPAEQVRLEMVTAQPDLAPALGRFFPEFRPAATKAIVDETSRANAQFALVSNVPAIVPVLGGFIAAGADVIVLTKNQIMMCYKLAALHGKDLHDQTRIITELVPVVGAGFLWRTAAREATSFLPLAAGTIPKVGIAYAGTMAVGWATDFYYRFGKKPTKSQLSEFTKRATELAQSIPLPGRDDGKRLENGATEAIDVTPKATEAASSETEKTEAIR